MKLMLSIFVTLYCAYLALGPVTKEYGVPKPNEDGFIFDSDVPISKASSPAPLIVVQDEYRDVWLVHVVGGEYPRPIIKRQYYLWLFGPKIKLPCTETSGVQRRKSET